jgi:hypothetical protein
MNKEGKHYENNVKRNCEVSFFIIEIECWELKTIAKLCIECLMI